MLLANGKEPGIVQRNLLIQGISWKPCKLVEHNMLADILGSTRNMFKQPQYT